MDIFVPAVAFMALVWKMIDFLKFVTNKDWNAVKTQLITWIGAIGVGLLWAQTQWAEGVSFGGLTLDKMNVWSIIAVGLGGGSAASVGFDLKKAFDSSDSAKTPALTPSAN
jgi:hypothetical protein